MDKSTNKGVSRFGKYYKLCRLLTRVNKTLHILGPRVDLNTANFNILDNLASLISIEKLLDLTIDKYTNWERRIFAYEIQQYIKQHAPIIVGELDKMRFLTLLYNASDRHRFIQKPHLKKKFKTAFPNCFTYNSSEYDFIKLLPHLGLINNKNNNNNTLTVSYKLKPLKQIAVNIKYISLTIFIMFLCGLICGYTFRNSVLMDSCLLTPYVP